MISNSFVRDLILVFIPLVGGVITGYIKGKKVSTDAINRKNILYQPLINELSVFNESKLNSKFKTTFLNEVVNNNYKYLIDNKLMKKLKTLRDDVQTYENIDLNQIAQDVFIENFINGFEDLHGSIINDFSDKEGVKEEVKELEILRKANLGDLVKTLLNSEGTPTYFISIKTNTPTDYVYPTYKEIIFIYKKTFSRALIQRSKKIEWEGIRAEYIEYTYGFFKNFNEKERVVQKKRLKEKIILNSEVIISELKCTISKIVKKYEKEVF